MLAYSKVTKEGGYMAKQSFNCSQCGSVVTRCPINPVTKLPIKNFFCDNDCKGRWQVEKREALGFTKDWLIDQYVTKGKDTNLIGREIGRDGHSVWNWIKGYGIPTRPRGHLTSNLVQDGSSFRGKKHTAKSKEKIRLAALADGRVPFLKNGKHWLKSVPKEQHPKWKGGLAPARQALYASEEWSDAVKAVWKRDNATCQLCKKHHNTAESRGTFHIHHIVPFEVEALRAKVDNLVLLCKYCHRFVHGKDNFARIYIEGAKK